MTARVALLFGLVTIQLMSGSGIDLTNVKARWALLPWQGFYSIPLSTISHKIKDYVPVTEGVSLPIPATLYCRPNDPRVCWMYDNLTNIVGCQVSFLKEDVKHVKGYDYNDTGSYVETNMFGIPAYSARVYFTDPAKLTEAGRPRSNEVVDGVWFQVQGKIVELPRNDPQVAVHDDWNRQACFPGMGRHYFYKMNNTMTDCSKMTPFGLYHGGSLIGLGIPAFGHASQAHKGRNWYETVPLLGAKMIMPNRPKCIDEFTSNYGLYSLHVYFVDYPMFVGCL